MRDDFYSEIEPGTIRVQCPAKINLFLHVIGKRSDGYHELCSLMCLIDLADHLSIRLKNNSFSIHCDHPEVPTDDSNLAVKAAKLFFDTLNKPDGAEIYLEKKIPVAAGLGGGSSNAAGVLMGLNRYFNNPMSIDQLMSLGLKLGADVPFFIFGKPAIARGIGEKLESYHHIPDCDVVVVTPPIRVSTAEVFKNLIFGLTKTEKNFKDLCLNTWMFDIRKDLHNDLESYTISKYPVIEEIKRILKQCGADGVLMSGSGSSVFGLFYDKRAAVETSRHIQSSYNNWDVFLSRLIK